MKNKIKKLSVMACALCAVVGAAGMLGACGEETYDYESLTWEQWNNISESHWDSKNISYQVVIGDVDDPDGADHSNRYVCLMNFYEDGTLVMYEMGVYFTSEGMKDPAWVDEDRHIAWTFFGLWEESDGGIVAYYFASVADEELTVVKSEEWAQNNFCFRTVFKGPDASGNYSYNGEDGTFGKLSQNMQAEIMMQGDCTTVNGDAIEYKTLGSWVDKILSDDISTWTEI